MAATITDQVPGWVWGYLGYEEAKEPSRTLKLEPDAEDIPMPAGRYLQSAQKQSSYVFAALRCLRALAHGETALHPKEWSARDFAQVTSWDLWNLQSNFLLASREVTVFANEFFCNDTQPAPGWHLLYDYHDFTQNDPRRMKRWVDFHLEGKGEVLSSARVDEVAPCLGQVVSWKRLRAVARQRPEDRFKTETGDLVVFVDERSRTYRWGCFMGKVRCQTPSLPFAYKLLCGPVDNPRSVGAVPMTSVLGVYRSEMEAYRPGISRLGVPGTLPAERYDGAAEATLRTQKGCALVLSRLAVNFFFATPTPLEWRVKQVAYMTYRLEEIGILTAGALEGAEDRVWNDLWNYLFAHEGLGIPSKAYGWFPKELPLGQAMFYDYYRLREYCKELNGLRAFFINHTDVWEPVIGNPIPLEVLKHCNFDGKRSPQRFGRGEWVAVLDEERQTYCYGMVIDQPSSTATFVELGVRTGEKTERELSVVEKPPRLIGKIKGVDLQGGGEKRGERR